jgi:hypothetical protein
MPAFRLMLRQPQTHPHPSDQDVSRGLISYRIRCSSFRSRDALVCWRNPEGPRHSNTSQRIWSMVRGRSSSTRMIVYVGVGAMGREWEFQRPLTSGNCSLNARENFHLLRARRVRCWIWYITEDRWEGPADAILRSTVGAHGSPFKTVQTLQPLFSRLFGLAVTGPRP